MKLLDHLAAVAVGWLVLSSIGGLAWCVCVTLHKARSRALRDRHPEVNWRPYLPPVPRPTTPPLTQTVASADWFWGIPSDCLSDDAIRALADDMDAHFRVIEGTDQ